MTVQAVFFDMGGTIETFDYTRELRLAATPAISISTVSSVAVCFEIPITSRPCPCHSLLVREYASIEAIIVPLRLDWL